MTDTLPHLDYEATPNHAGDDLHRFERGVSDRAEFYVRQVLSSVNFTTGGDLRDFCQGFLNYQLEHHLWPDLPPRAYQRIQPQVKAVCERHGVPYVQEPIVKRIGKLADIIVGRRSMRRGETRPRAARRVAASPMVDEGNPGAPPSGGACPRHHLTEALGDPGEDARPSVT